MRRDEKEITDRNLIEEILNKATTCRIAMIDGDFPYIIPVNYGYKDNCIYIHSANEGKKIDVIKKNNNVCFEVEIDEEIVETDIPCTWSVNYQSVIGFGKAFILDSNDDKINGLNVLMEHYTGRTKHEYQQKSMEEMIIIKIEISSMTGKKSD